MDVLTLITVMLLIVFNVALMAVGIVNYVLGSMGLYRIAAKRGVPGAWIAWIPLINSWIIGSIVDDFESEKGIKRKFRVMLLTLALLMIVVCIAVMVAWCIFIIMLSYSNEFYYAGDADIIFVVFGYAGILIASYISVAYAAMGIISLYKLHECIYPEKSVKYIIISLLVPLGAPICLLKNAKRCPEKTVVAPCYTVEEVPAEITQAAEAEIVEEVSEENRTEE